MERHDIAIPILPSRSFENTIEFFRRLGFDGRIAGENYAILHRGTVELHFFLYPELDPAESFAGCYVRVTDVDGLYASFAAAKLPREGIPRISALESKPWGMREFALIDADGNLFRIGQAL